ncbi:MAG: hypothetical protein ACE5K8_07545 [Candidatus Zixiibacteriota bacterium]
MSNRIKTISLILPIILIMCALSEARILRVAKRYHLIDFYAGYATPHGEYWKMGDVHFVDRFSRPVALDADEWLDETYFLGFDYGTLYRAHWLFMVGFRFTDHNVMDVFDIPEEILYRQYDLELNLNHMFNDLGHLYWSPYVGIGTQMGFTSFKIKGTANDQSDLKFAFSLNFGVDFKIWGAPGGRSFVTLSSINNFNLFASDDRPKYLNLGAGIKYYFRP